MFYGLPYLEKLHKSCTLFADGLFLAAVQTYSGVAVEAHRTRLAIDGWNNNYPNFTSLHFTDLNRLNVSEIRPQERKESHEEQHQTRHILLPLLNT